MEGISIETYQLIYEWNKNQKYRKLKADAVKSPLNTFFINLFNPKIYKSNKTYKYLYYFHSIASIKNYIIRIIITKPRPV